MKRLSYHASRWFLAIIFMYAGATKAVNMLAFQQSMYESGFVSQGSAELISVILPILEIALSIMLALDMIAYVVVPIVLMLSLSFVGIHAYAIMYGPIDCGCMVFPLEANQKQWIMLYVSIAMIVCAVILTWQKRPRDRHSTSEDEQPVSIHDTSVTG